MMVGAPRPSEGLDLFLFSWNGRSQLSHPQGLSH